jgi:hypothetical protein
VVVEAADVKLEVGEAEAHAFVNIEATVSLKFSAQVIEVQLAENGAAEEQSQKPKDQIVSDGPSKCKDAMGKRGS